MPDLEPLLRFWRTLDERFQRVEPTPWGAIVTDARFPAIWDVNYARVETIDPLSLGTLERPLLPALRRAGAEHTHIVLFHPDAHTDLLTDASTRGDRLSWDAVMRLRRRRSEPPPDPAAEEVTRLDDRFWDELAGSLPAFDVTDEASVEQIVRIERELLLPSGKRWFAVRDGSALVGFGSLLTLEGVGFVDHVVTLPEARRRGYATAILRRIIEEAGTGGAGSLWLLTDPGGEAERLYRRLGFVTVGQIASTLRRR